MLLLQRREGEQTPSESCQGWQLEGRACFAFSNPLEKLEYFPQVRAAAHTERGFVYLFASIPCGYRPFSGLNCPSKEFECRTGQGLWLPRVTLWNMKPSLGRLAL